jgi:hypothetical protein
MTGDTECGGHRGHGCRRSTAICGALADPDDQRAIVLTAYARTGRAGSYPDRYAHDPSVRPAFCRWPTGRALKPITEATLLAVI